MTVHSRRTMLASTLTGSLLLDGLMSELLADEARDPLAPKQPHSKPKAKSVIFLFMSGGVSHVDSFDPKPKLSTDHGKQVTFDHPETMNRPGYEKLFLKRPDWKFKPRGRSGIEVSDLFPSVAEQIDDITLIRSMHTSHSNHYNATLGMHTGSFAFARPSNGAWTSYGLGTVQSESAILSGTGSANALRGHAVWASDFLPGVHQGTRIVRAWNRSRTLNTRDNGTAKDGIGYAE